MLYGELYYFREVYKVMSDYQAQKSKWQSFVSIVSGRRLLSTMPDVTYHSMIPEIPDPFLNSVLELRGRWNFGPIIVQIDAGAYDLIIVKQGDAGTRFTVVSGCGATGCGKP